ncbi:MAG: class I SAM-dependent methyltransferase [Gammaproteobacteria bacterium]|nr:class I SAM-dependent methyltransferase [Gammaproteobacteria bacterium]
MDPKQHWERVYANKSTDRLGWYEPHLQTTLNWIRELGLGKDASIIDVGGGASTLVDDLLDGEFQHLTILDLSKHALATVKTRLGAAADKVTWREGDITSVQLPPAHYDLWHDRAVFHFLTNPEDRKKYAVTLDRALKSGGHVIIGTFAPEAPPRCSGLEVERYSPERLHQELGERLVLQTHRQELHVTPGGVKQMYLYCRFRKPA